MSFLPNIQPHANRRASDSDASTRVLGRAPSELRSTPDRSAWSATRATSNQPSESSDATMFGALYDGGTPDNASCVTFQDAFPWHQVGIEKVSQKIPATIVPALLQPRASLESDEGGGREVDRESSGSEDDAPRYSASQKGKWRGDGGCVVLGDDPNDASRSPSPQFHFDEVHNSVEDWVIHNRPILQDYAERQASLPLGRRLEVSIDEPPQFILGAFQLLVNRDKRSIRRLGPQLIENFVDIDRWAKEYFRYRHGMQVVDNDIPALLTIVMSNFYEGMVQLIDRLADFALENMRHCGRSYLSIEDFSFGFDFRMSQDLPFHVETSSRIREPLPIPAVEVQHTQEPVTTSYGRQVKPTERALASSRQAKSTANGRRNKGENTSEAKDKEAAKPPAPRQTKKATRSSPRRTEDPATSQANPSAAEAPVQSTSAHTKYRPNRPSNLGSQPPVLASSSPGGATSLPSNESAQSESSTSATAVSPNVPASTGSNLTAGSFPRLTITLPVPSLPTSTLSAAGGSEGTEGTNGEAPQTTWMGKVSETTNGARGASRSGTVRPRRRGRRGRERRSTSVTPSVGISGDAEVVPTGHLLKVGSTENSAAADPPEGCPALEARVEGSTGTPSTKSHHIDRSSTRGKGTCARQPSPPHVRTGKLALPLADPGHSRAKKRKLDDCEE